MKLGKCYRIERISSIMVCGYFLRSRTAMHAFSTELPWSHQRFYVNRYYVDTTAQTDTRDGDCCGSNGKMESNYGGQAYRLRFGVAKVQVFKYTH